LHISNKNTGALKGNQGERHVSLKF